MIKSKKFKDTLKLFKENLMNLGYTLYDDLLCAKDYGIPQTRTRYFFVAILNNEFNFPKKIESDVILKDLIEQYVDEKYYLTNSNYIKKDNIRIFKHKTKSNIEYEVDMNKYFNDGICCIDKHTKFAIPSRLFSVYGNSPTLTASNTTDNSKIVIECGKNNENKKKREEFQKDAIVKLKMLDYISIVVENSNCILSKQFKQISIQIGETINLIAAWKKMILDGVIVQIVNGF